MLTSIVGWVRKPDEPSCLLGRGFLFWNITLVKNCYVVFFSRTFFPLLSVALTVLLGSLQADDWHEGREGHEGQKSRAQGCLEGGGSLLTAQGSKLHHIDVNHHLQQASKAFFVNRWILKGHQVSTATRLKYFDEVVTTVACFAAGRRALYKNDLENMGVFYRKLCRQIVGPPPAAN